MALLKLAGVVLDGAAGTFVPTRQDLTFPQGEDVTFQVTITGQGGAAINVTGFTGAMVWKFAQNQTMAASLTLPAVLTNPSQGIISFVLSAVTSKGLPQSMYWYDVFLVTGSGLKDEIVPTSLITLNYSVGA